MSDSNNGQTPRIASEPDDDFLRSGTTSRRSFLKTAGLGVGALALGQGTGFASAAGSSYNLAEALQKSLYFYDANKCGPDVTGGRLDWRGDCHDTDTEVPLAGAVAEGGTNLSQGFIESHRDVLDPEGTGTVDLSGGFHDAGDHVKFGLPQCYSASTLGWVRYEFGDAFEAIGSDDHLVSHLRRFADYLRKCTFRDDSGDVVAFCYQVSNGGSSFDHNYWGPPELQDPEQSPRPAYFATPENPASDRSAAAAAALAVIAANLEAEDPEYAADCLDVARALYRFAIENRGIPQTAAPYYESTSDSDDLCWAALWLHEATGEAQYLDDVLGADGGSYTGHISEIVSSPGDVWNNTWVHSWDSVWGGVLLRLGVATGDEEWWNRAFWNLAFWSGGDVEHRDGDGSYIQTTPAGFSWLNQWGSARYNAAAQLCAMVYHKHRDHGELADWALGQMEYIMGDNPFDYSLIVGFTDDYAERPHHDAAHGSLAGKPSEPKKHRHTLWGALVGGPDSSDNHVDETGDYIHNEVTIDYNAGLVGALAGLYSYFSDADDEPVADFPPEHEDENPYYVEAAVTRESDSRIDYESYIVNESFYPPEPNEGMSFRYFFDVSALREAGGSVSDVTVDVTYDSLSGQYDDSVEVIGPKAWDEDEGVYYVEFDFSGHELHGKRELSFALAAYSVDGFDPSNHWSRQNLSGELRRHPRLPVFVDGEHVFGMLPDGSEPGDATAPTAPSDLSVGDSDGTSVPLTWEAASDTGGSGLDHYRLSVDGEERTKVPAEATSTTVDGLTAGTEYEFGVRAVDAAGNESDPATVTATLDTGGGVSPIDGKTPTDPDGDGKYEDLNGNGRTDSDDVVTFFKNKDDAAITDHVDKYDFNGNGRIDFDDVASLFDEV